jgi:VCBS repeat-containing protein
VSPEFNDASLAINAGDASILSNTELMPASEYVHPITQTTRMKIGAPDVGAHEASSTIPPEIGVIADQQILEDTAISAIGFTITDLDNDAADLIVQGSSSNISLVANSNISFAGIGADRYISITPTVNENDVLTITVFVTDGSFTSTTSFNLTVTAVNDAPEISTIDDHSISEDACLTGVNFTVSDIESSNLLVSA